MMPDQYQPRLEAWGYFWRICTVILVGAVAWYEIARWQWVHDRTWFFADLVLGLICLALALWRRRFPVPVALLSAFATVVSSSAAGPATWALVSLSTRRNLREVIPVAVVSVVANVVRTFNNPTETQGSATTWSWTVVIIGVSVGWGMFIGSRRELLTTLRERAENAEAQQVMRLDAERAAERTRIAREMHDVLAHRISLAAMHAGALAHRTDLSAGEMRDSARVIQDSSHQALTELRQVLGILRDDQEREPGYGPQPSATDIEPLVDASRTSGMQIRFTNHVRAGDVTEPAGRTLYRVAQEAITNARKHAPDTTVMLSLEGTPSSGLALEARNPLHLEDSAATSPPSGLGLVGLAERVELCGGELTHQVTGDNTFVLHAWIPWYP